MQYADWRIREQPQVPLTDAYIRFLAGAFIPDKYSDKQTLRQFQGSVALAQAARAKIQDNNTHRMHSILSKAKPLFKELQIDRPISLNNRMACLGMLAARSSLLFSNNRVEIQTMRTRLHLESVLFASEALSAANHNKVGTGIGVGMVCEAISFSLLNRNRHPWTMTVPALPHQDQGRVIADNFDGVYIESSPFAPSTTIRKLQVKTGCLGYCNKPFVPSTASYRQYGKDITMISGCCDLSVTHEGSNITAPVIKLLVNEVINNASASDTKLLDNMTDNLLFGITSDERRSGKVTY